MNKFKFLIPLILMSVMTLCSFAQAPDKKEKLSYQEISDMSDRAILIIDKKVGEKTVYLPSYYRLKFSPEELKTIREDVIEAYYKQTEASAKGETYQYCGGNQGCPISAYYEYLTGSTCYCWLESPTGQCKTACVQITT